MRALVLEEFGRLAVRDRPDPVAGAGEVLIAVIATGICGTDVHGFTGENGRRIPGQVMGHECVGRIVTSGPNPGRSDLAPGTVVTFNPVVVPEAELDEYAGREQYAPNKKVIGVAPELSAGFAELIVVPARNVVVLPPELPVLLGALVEPLAVAVHAVSRAGVQPGDAVAVFGGGPIGQSVVLALAMAGCTQVVVSEPDANRRELVSTLGTATIDPASGGVAEAVRAQLGRPADAAIDAVGIERTLADALASTRFGASVCLVGMGSQRLALDAFRVSTEERSIIGSFTYSAQDFTDAANWVATAPEIVTRMISREVSLDEANAAFTGLAAADGTAGKVLIRMDL